MPVKVDGFVMNEQSAPSQSQSECETVILKGLPSLAKGGVDQPTKVEFQTSNLKVSSTASVSETIGGLDDADGADGGEDMDPDSEDGGSEENQEINALFGGEDPPRKDPMSVDWSI
eukprot:NODE_6819_length_487_cov_50.817352_g6025_i0.p2 GENE.NODE_6819_length_487_cov_50.817352_g6025_i0~~NODE_6819_length_487_cov_50.817352_g6025_i0.p2  ORF type:complete len:134 (-),score=38.70 NODE_6819_length_487_cov_50.817352_g6025_i0:84-431(-)